MQRLINTLFFPLVAVLFAFIVGGIVVLAVGDSPLLVYELFFSSAFGTIDGFGYTLFYATPLILTGLAVAVAFRCGLLNIGAEGQLYVASFAAAWVGIKFGGAMSTSLARKRTGRGSVCRRSFSLSCV